MIRQRVPWVTSKNTGCCQGYKLLSTDWQQDTFAEDTTYTTYWIWRSQAGTYIWPLPLCVASLVRKVLHLLPRVMETPKPTTGPLIYRASCLQDARSIVVQEGESDQYLIWLKARTMRQNPYVPLWWPRTWDSTEKGPRITSNTTVVRTTTTGCSIKLLLIMCCYTHRSVCATARHYGEWETLECADLNEMSPSNLSPQGSESFTEEEAEGV